MSKINLDELIHKSEHELMELIGKIKGLGEDAIKAG